MTVRTMTIEDYDGIYELWIHSPGMGLNTIDDSREGIAKYLQRNPTTSFVAEENGELVGCIMCGHDGRRGLIHHTAVKASEQGQGIGKALVEHAVAALKDEGINKVSLVVFSKNTFGNAFWEKQGFSLREDLVYRNKSINELTRIDT